MFLNGQSSHNVTKEFAIKLYHNELYNNEIFRFNISDCRKKHFHSTHFDYGERLEFQIFSGIIDQYNENVTNSHFR